VPDKPVYAARHYPLLPVFLDPDKGRLERVISVGSEEQEERSGKQGSTENGHPEGEDGGPPEPFCIERHDENPEHEPDHDPVDNIYVPAFLVAGTWLFVAFFKQGRVFMMQIQDGRITEKNEPDAEYPAGWPGVIPGEEEDQCRE